ncbi:diguanylate cyclase [uncultured Psychromonas sp.]|uniref:sensor domain-containing diguanylate cyclase n=1 Tax=uncultured Psychromonas sp. TaxID=173974 RepID=UPI00262F2B62|nr:diguanylate cyclase [uncultured Psychromonas sp.]
MKLRHILVITFAIIVIIPMTLFWIWPYSKALELEVKEVNEKHLVIAKNLSAAFERYYQDVTGIFSIVASQSKKQLESTEFKQLLNSYKFNDIVLINDEGVVQNCLFSTYATCMKNVDNTILTLAKNTVTTGSIEISTVTEDKTMNNGPILLVVKKVNNNILLAYLSTDYIIEMGKRVAFGEKGHAAIVDKAGNVLAHPLDSWIQERKSMIAISPIKKMLAGKTGVDKFYSPALKGDMIAGYTQVPNAKWGVMVPQPIKELENKADAIDQTAIFVMLLGLGLALLITIPVSLILIKPLENLLRAIKLIEQGDSNVNLQWNLSKLIPLELQQLKMSFANMMQNIEKNKKEISKLAYFDATTGLPNRNYFYRLSNKALDKMLKTNQTGALVFIDFDGFKAVNDTYGHRVGDELLFLFGKRLAAFLSFNSDDEQIHSFSECLPLVIPARLGGDEFVILFQDIQNKNEIALILETLFEKLFFKYELHDGVELTVTGSAGIALYPENGQRYDQLMKSADIAMYDAKSAGKNRVKFAKKGA